MKGVATMLAAPAVGVLLGGCANVQPLGRMQPYLGEYNDCGAIGDNIALVNRFQESVTSSTAYNRAKGILFGTQGDELAELQAALKSGIVRRIGLDEAWTEKACEGGSPTYTGPPPCKTTWARMNLDRGPDNKRFCVGFSRKEQKRYGLKP